MDSEINEETKFQTLVVERKARVGVITLNRPDQLNALNSLLLRELKLALSSFEHDSNIGCILLTGSGRAFCAGADIKEVMSRKFPESFLQDFFDECHAMAAARKPTIAAVNGFALGGGCEIALMCDLIIAAEAARFALPEIRIGTMPGAGGTQRLVRSIGKAKAMDLCLTGRQLDASEAERLGLISRVVSGEQLMEVAHATAVSIAAASLPAALAIKECVNFAFEGSLHQGLILEKRLFHALFATEDQKEGMAAFVEKRPPEFRHR